MGKTFDQSLIDVAKIPMSLLDPDEIADTTSEEFISLRRVQQGCHTELTGREDFPFNKYTDNLTFVEGQDLYEPVEGEIKEIRIYNSGNITKINYDENLALYNAKIGMPEKFNVLYNPEKLKIYPTPDKNYTVGIDYISTKNVILADNTHSYIIEVNSTLRMPERFQHLYFDALEYYTLAINMRKLSNPRFQPTLDIFKQRWQTFLKGCKAVDSETRFTL